MIRNNKEIKDLNIFDHLFNTQLMQMIQRFFLKKKESIEELVKIFTSLSSFSGLKPNTTKCEICGLGPLKGVEMAVSAACNQLI